MSGEPDSVGRPAAAVAEDAGSRRWVAEEEAAAARLREQGTGLAAVLRPLGEAAAGLLAGAGLRLVIPHPAWAVMAAVAAVAGLVAACTVATPPLVRVMSRRGLVVPRAGLTGTEPEWVTAAGEYRAWLPDRVPPVPPQTLAAADRYLAGVTARGWRSAHLMIARPADGVPVNMAVTTGLFSDRVQIILGDHVAEGPPGVAAATLAHEARHATGLHAAVWALAQVAWRFLPLVGWVVPWPDALWAGLAVYAGAAAAKWALEISADLAAAQDAGPDVMAQVYQVMARSARARRRPRPALARVGLLVLVWAAVPGHPPIPVRRAIIRARYLRRQAGGGR